MTKYQNSLNLLLIFHFVHQHNHSFLQTPQGMPPWFNLQTEWELLLLSKKRKVLVISWVKKSFNNKQSNCYKSLSVIHACGVFYCLLIYLFICHRRGIYLPGSFTLIRHFKQVPHWSLCICFATFLKKAILFFHIIAQRTNDCYLLYREPFFILREWPFCVPVKRKTNFKTMNSKPVHHLEIKVVAVVVIVVILHLINILHYY